MIAEDYGNFRQIFLSVQFATLTTKLMIERGAMLARAAPELDDTQKQQSSGEPGHSFPHAEGLVTGFAQSLALKGDRCPDARAIDSTAPTAG
jgi:hypothetical protein